MATLIRRSKTPTTRVRLGDFVLYAGKYTGLVDTIVNLVSGVRIAYVTEWDGRGGKPRAMTAKRYICEEAELSVVPMPPPLSVPLLRRRR